MLENRMIDGLTVRNRVLAVLQNSSCLGGQAGEGISNKQGAAGPEGGKYVSDHLFGVLGMVCF